MLVSLRIGTNVGRMKGIKSTREMIRASDGNWNTGLPFPVNIMDGLYKGRMRICPRRFSFGDGKL